MTAPHRQRLRLAVFASGRGSNFEAILAAVRAQRLDADLVALCSDKPASRAVDVARQNGIDVIALAQADFADRRAFDHALFDRTSRYAPDLIVLAGFMRIVDSNVIDAWRGRIINIHPSLLPKFAGLRTHQRALDAHEKFHGASVHFVTPQLDGGPVISHVQIEVQPGDDESKLAARLLPMEHRLLVATLQLFAARRISLDGDNVIVDTQRLDRPLRYANDGFADF